MPLLTSPTKKTGIISVDPIANPQPKPADFVQETTSYTPPTVDLRWIPEDSLITQVSGSPWVVDYYSQVITKDSELGGLQLTTSGVYQQYTHIASLELRVSTPLAATQDDVSTSFTATGTSIIFPVVIPNVGDMFLAEMAPGQLGLYQVTRSVKKSLFTQSCYEIEYLLDSTDAEKIATLRSRVVQSYYYYSTYFNHGRNPLVVEKQAKSILSLTSLVGDLIQNYLNTFFSREHLTLMLPEQGAEVTDTFLTNYFLRVVETADDPRVSRLIRLNVSSLSDHQEVTILDAIHEQSLFKFNRLSSQFRLITRASFDSFARLKGFRWSTIDFAVWPTSHHYDVDRGYGTRSVESPRKLIQPGDPMLRKAWGEYTKTLFKPPGDLSPAPEPQDPEYADLYDMYSWEEQETIDRYKSLVAISLFGSRKSYAFCVQPARTDDSYIFGPDFYKAKPSCIFECVLIDHMKKLPIDPSVLFDLASLSTRWTLLDQFYYTPIIIDLIKRHVTTGRT